MNPRFRKLFEYIRFIFILIILTFNVLQLDIYYRSPLILAAYFNYFITDTRDHCELV